MLAANSTPSAHPLLRQISNGSHRLSAPFAHASRSRASNMNEDAAAGSALGSGSNGAEGVDAATAEEDPRYAEFQDRFAQTQSRILALFSRAETATRESGAVEPQEQSQEEHRPAQTTKSAVVAKRPARTIDEDDYGDEDEEEDEDDGTISPLQGKGIAAVVSTASDASPPTAKLLSVLTRPSANNRSSASSSEAAKSSDDLRRKLQEDKEAAEHAVKQSFHTMFYTLETDRDAMIEQKKLDELDRQVETETSGSAATNAGSATGTTNQQGTLSSANLGASSLTLKHLIARIDSKRGQVQASDAQLRSLMSEVRKGRSKWASEDKVGQEELYEAAERVLVELKAQTEHAAPFLQRVNKRDAPDYYNVIKHPMDIGTMLKKLKQCQYRSKKEFVDDLHLIWSNCLKYNADPAHFLRKKALYMRKETEKLVPMIPDIVVRDRAEVEAEERRQQNADAELDGIEDSDDEEPIMASRGRKAPSKGKKGTTTARKAPPSLEGTPGTEVKPFTMSLGSSTSNLKNEFLRADSDAPMEGSDNGLSTPPPGTLTPLGMRGNSGSGAPGSQADVSEIDGMGLSVNALATSQAEDVDLDDLEYKTWKQVTKKARAMVAAERNRLFRGDHLNSDEPALLRSKAGMRRWLRQHKQALGDRIGPEATSTTSKDGVSTSAGETLAEGIKEEEENLLPDYYDPLSAIPDLNERLKWAEDSEGHVIDQAEEFLRMVPKGYFTSPESELTRKMDANMRQLQETRKICAKIGIVKQMQLQSQMYQNQFQKYDPQPFVEADIQPLVVSDDGPVMSPWVCRAALERTVGKIFYHAGFEECQPTALESVTNIAEDFFKKLAHTLSVYGQAPKVQNRETATSDQPAYKPRFTPEEIVLHCLHENGQDLEALDSYVKEDMDRLGTKLNQMHERMKSFLAELLRPALDPNAGADGAGAFNDGSEQFVGGDFAEDIDVDFFGFRELGLDKEFGLESLSVPFHLLQNRMHNAYQAQNTSSASVSGMIMEQPPPYEPVTIHNIGSEIGLVQGWFLAKLHANNDEPLVEDDDLPVKQRFPKPRLPPTGKITSPRKRPIREQQQLAKKRRKLEEGNETSGGKSLTKPVGKLRLEMPGTKEPAAEPEKDENSAVGMMSPESLDR